MKSKKGSALIVAIFLSTIMLAVLASLLSRSLSEYRGAMKSYFDTAAFSLAESGIDRAAAFIVAAKFDSAVTAEPTGTIDEAGVWYKKMDGATVKYYRGYFPAVDLGNNRRGSCSVLVEPAVVSGTTTTYLVHALGSANNGSGVGSQRALRVKLASTTTKGAGGGAAVLADELLGFGTGANENQFDVPSRTARLLVAAYDSNKNNGNPDMTVDLKTGEVTGANFSDSAMVGLRAVNGKAKLWSSLIYGTVAVGGGKETLEFAENSKINTSEWVSDNPYAACVIDLTAAAKWKKDYDGNKKAAYMGMNKDTLSPSGQTYVGDNVVYNYTFEGDPFALTGFDAAGKFVTDGIAEAKAKDGHTGEDLLASGGKATKTLIGVAKTKTVTTLTSVNGLGEIVVKGDAVLVLSGPSNLDGGDGIKLSFADSDSKLTMVLVDTNTATIKFANADNNIAGKDNLDPDNNKAGVGYRPDRLTIMSSAAVSLKLRIGATKAVAAVVKIPNGEVQVDCQEGGKAIQFRGQLIADKINLDGSTHLDIFYDVNLGGKPKDTSGLVLASWKQILASGFSAQL